MSLGLAKHLQFIDSIHLLEDESFLLCPSLPLPAPCPHPLELATWQKIMEVLFLEILLKTDDLPPSLQGFGHNSGAPNKLSNLIHAFLVSGKSQSTNGRN